MQRLPTNSVHRRPDCICDIKDALSSLKNAWAPASEVAGLQKPKRLQLKNQYTQVPWKIENYWQVNKNHCFDVLLQCFNSCVKFVPVFDEFHWWIWKSQNMHLQNLTWRKRKSTLKDANLINTLPAVFECIGPERIYWRVMNGATIRFLQLRHPKKVARGRQSAVQKLPNGCYWHILWNLRSKTHSNCFRNIANGSG